MIFVGSFSKSTEAVRRGLQATSAGKGYSKAKSQELAGQARQLAANQALSDALKLALKYGLLKAPQINDPGFVSQLVFGRR